ncbi:MAG: FtsQ-type POTRA domain-containing protein [Alphaproteobacteria bacterium GM7ARS4]|nr:FtsQ-type POTRA domain-containing protein [Alphaproteobacteria bacterium GM7ARS4]
MLKRMAQRMGRALVVGWRVYWGTRYHKTKACVALFLLVSVLWSVDALRHAVIPYGERALIRVSHHLGFVVRHVTIDGTRSLSYEDVLRASGLADGMSLASFSVDDVRARVRTLEWVRDVRVRRYWGGHIHITLYEREAFLVWKKEHRFFLVDTQGVTIEEVARDIVPSHVVISTRERLASGLALYQALSDVSEGVLEIRAIADIGGARWEIHIEGDIIVFLPVAEPITAWSRMVKARRDSALLLGDDVAYVDIRTKDKMVLSLKTPPSEWRQRFYRMMAQQRQANTAMHPHGQH